MLKNASLREIPCGKSQFMNNKILFIKHSTIKRNVALDFPINNFPSSFRFLLLTSLSRFSTSTPPYPLFVSGELYHFIAIIFIILFGHKFLHWTKRTMESCDAYEICGDFSIFERAARDFRWTNEFTAALNILFRAYHSEVAKLFNYFQCEISQPLLSPLRLMRVHCASTKRWKTF